MSCLLKKLFFSVPERSATVSTYKDDLKHVEAFCIGSVMLQAPANLLSIFLYLFDLPLAICEEMLHGGISSYIICRFNWLGFFWGKTRKQIIRFLFVNLTEHIKAVHMNKHKKKKGERT